MKLNHFICPNCGHDFYAEGAYAVCDACQLTFDASQSRTCKPTNQLPAKPINPVYPFSTTAIVSSNNLGRFMQDIYGNIQ